MPLSQPLLVLRPHGTDLVPRRSAAVRPRLTLRHAAGELALQVGVSLSGDVAATSFMALPPGLTHQRGRPRWSPTERGASPDKLPKPVHDFDEVTRKVSSRRFGDLVGQPKHDLRQAAGDAGNGVGIAAD